MIWVRTGVISVLISFNTLAPISSVPQEDVPLRFDRIFRTVSGWTGFREKEQFRFSIIFLTRTNGFPAFFGKVCLSVLTLFMKNEFII